MDNMILLDAWPAIRFILILGGVAVLGHYLQLISGKRWSKQKKPARGAKKPVSRRRKKAGNAARSKPIDLSGIRNKQMKQGIKDLAQKHGVKVED